MRDGPPMRDGARVKDGINEEINTVLYKSDRRYLEANKGRVEGHAKYIHNYFFFQLHSTN